MRAIFKREMRAYFASPVGYVVVAARLRFTASSIIRLWPSAPARTSRRCLATMFMFSMMIMPITRCAA